MTPDRPRAVVTPTRCGVCRRPVQLVQTVGHVALVEDAGDGRREPHRCPDEAVEEYARQRRIMARRLGLLMDRPDPDRTGGHRP